MVGGSYSKRLNKELTVKAKGFGGIGFVYAKGSSNASGSITNRSILQGVENWLEQNIPNIGDLPSVDKLTGSYEIYDVDEHRECLVVDLSLGLEYELSQRWALGIDVGYRYTPEVKMDQLKLDFSGFKVVGGVIYRI
jgi:opacity protein-like surface antigen